MSDLTVDAAPAVSAPALSGRTRRLTVPSRQAIKRAVLGLGLAAGAAAAANFGYHYWTVGRFLESTDDAYVQADYTTVAPKISGYITEVLVEDNQPVKAGQVLARIDERDFKTALDQAKADVAAAEAAIHDLDSEAALQQSVIDQQKAAIAATEATLKYAAANRDRYAELARVGAAAIQRAQETESALGEQSAHLMSDRAGLIAAERKVEVIAAERVKAVAQLARAQAVQQQAELNLSYATITAPVDGTVGARQLRVGQYVQAGTQLMAVVPLKAAYVIANFKETQLTHVRNGQRVSIAVDGFPSQRVTGYIDSLSPASGLEFALLPPDNATGNFVKVVQRVPVLIRLDDSPEVELRPGMSADVTVDTRVR